jgi:alpha-L-fucosidase
MVFTTKHADGFRMFDSEYTDYKITRTPYAVIRRLESDLAAKISVSDVAGATCA